MDTATLQSLIAAYGYWVLTAGCLLEGETILILAGFAAHRGLLDPWAVWVVAASAGFLGDQIFFWLGRHHGAQVLARWPSLAVHADRLKNLERRWHAVLIIGIRFAYGLRIAGPILIGSSRMSARRFAIFNAIGAAIWATVIGGLGWVFGQAAEALLGDMQNLEIWFVGAAVIVAAGLWLYHRLRAGRAHVHATHPDIE
jgi:membrane protein DedA with SNARE-associated domain